MEVPHTPNPGDRAEQLLAEVVVLPATEQAAVFARLVSQHPELGAELRQRYELFRRLAELGPSLPPERAALRQFGEYELVREVGSGGMGVVYLARQRRGDQERLVALKLVRDRGLLSSQARERLRREGAAAFQLDHPSICQVLDVGEVDGTPFLTMRFVPGATLAEHIATAREAGRPLELPRLPATDTSPTATASTTSGGDRLRVILAFVEQVARALHVAHEAGFVHRDVKPGNLMVTPEGLPVLLDFGLVRDESSAHGLTVSGQSLGTPAYMSPEQIEPRGRVVDRTTDVYSLGATLYEALTLQQPFHGPTREALFHDILTSRPADLRRAAPAAGRDLRVVVETALDREPRRRYATALDFAEELRRVRLAQPIAARPPSPARRLHLWCRRNPLAAGILVLLVVALVANVWLAASAQQRATEAKLAQQRAQADFADARDAVNELTTMARTHLSDVPWLEPVRRELYERALAFHRRFLGHASNAPELRQETAITKVEYGTLTAQLGDFATARDMLQQGTAALQELAGDRDAEALTWLARGELMLAQVAMDRGDSATAEPAFRRSITTLEALTTDRLPTAWEACTLLQAHRGLAMSLEARNHLAEASHEVTAALGVQAATPHFSVTIERAKALGVQGRLRRLQNDLVGADADLRQAADLLRGVLASEQHDREARASLATNLISHGALLTARGDAEGAMSTYAEARALLETLTTTFPLARPYRINLAALLNNQATLLRRQNQPEAAKQALERATDLAEALSQEDPASTESQQVLAQTRHNLANTIRDQEPERAITLFGAALTTLEQLLQNRPDDRESRDLAWRSANSLGAALAERAQDQAALANFKKAREHGNVLLEQSAHSPRWMKQQAVLLFNEGTLACEMGDLAMAQDCLTEGVDLDARYTAAAPDDGKARAEQWKHHMRLGQVATLRDPSTALVLWQAAAAVLSATPASLRQRLETVPSACLDAGAIERGLAESLLAAGDATAAGEALQRATTLLDQTGQGLVPAVERLLLAATRAQYLHALDQSKASADALRATLNYAADLIPGISNSRLHSDRLRVALPKLVATAKAVGVDEAEGTIERLLGALAPPR